jgi:hypothetical protein
VLENVLALLVFVDLASPGRFLLGVMHVVTALNVIAVFTIATQLVWLVSDQRAPERTAGLSARTQVSCGRLVPARIAADVRVGRGQVVRDLLHR